MKQTLHRNLFLAFCLLLTAPAFAQQAGPQYMNRSAGDNWYRQASAYLVQKEYFIVSSGEKNVFAAANRKQQSGFLFSPLGYRVKRFDFKKKMEPLDSFSFSLKGIGRENSISFFSASARSSYNNGNLYYHYGHFTVEYINAPQGMRQNFILNKKPSGKGDIQVKLQLEGSLSPVLQSPGQLALKNERNEDAWYYNDLKAWDAYNRILPAYMQWNKDNHELIVAVNDKDAVYPVTIDPLNYDPDWSHNGDGLVFPLLDDLTSPTLYGYSVSGAGDVNNDSYDDVIIGAPSYVEIVNISANTFNMISVGAAFVYYGGAGGLSVEPNEALQPTSVAGALCGFSVSSAGDIDNDGLDDIVIGAPGDEAALDIGLGTQNVSIGQAYIYYGSSFDGDLNTEPVAGESLRLQQADFGTLPSVPANPLYGFSVSGAGDANGDGYSDIVVGSPAYIELISLDVLGRVDIYYGSPSGIITSPGTTITGTLVNGLFGYSVSDAGKVNNDTFDDIIVGAPASVGIVAVGAAYIFHGSAGGVTATSFADANTILQAPGLLSQTLFGFSVSKAGDVNADGFGDVIIGEPLTLETESLEVIAVGKANIYYGSNSGVQSGSSTELTSPRSPNLLGAAGGNLLYGYSVSYAGDMNCDGVDDVIVGEPGGTAISLGSGALGLTSTNTLSGRVYLYEGLSSTGPLDEHAWMLEENGSLSAANLLGASVQDAGDVNGDGFHDMIIGAPNGTLNLAGSLTAIVGNAVGIITTNSTGKSYTYHGCLTTNITLPVTLFSFSGKLAGSSVRLEWETSSEVNNNYFEVLRSTDGINFVALGRVEAAGSVNAGNTYYFDDNQPAGGMNFYKLKMVSIDGRQEYSDIVFITLENDYRKEIRLFPNPVVSSTRLTFKNLPPALYTLDIIQGDGRLVRTQKVSISGLYQSINIQKGNNWTSGVYLFRVTNTVTRETFMTRLLVK